MKRSGLDRRSGAGRLVRCAIALLAMTLSQPVFSQTLRQITDFRADRLGDHAIDDAGMAVVVVTTADPFSSNPRHEFQAVEWTGTGAGSALTGFGGLGTTVSVSDDGQWIAFVSIGDPLGQNNDRSLELFIQSADGSVLRQLTDHPDQMEQQVVLASIAGSANRVAFVVTANDAASYVNVVDATGGTPVQLTPHAGLVDRLSISDDGDAVVFSADGDPLGNNADGSFEVFHVRADGSDFRWLTSTTNGAKGAMISGDGQLATYESEGQVFIIPASGGTSFLLGAGVQPSITDDATWVYFSAQDEDNLEIHRSLSTGGGAQRLTRTAPPLQNDRPVISGDGTRVAFIRYGAAGDPDGQRRLMLMNSNGSGVEQLGTPETDWKWWEPDITPDGKRIVFLGGTAGRHDVFRIEADGSDLAQITDGGQALHPSVAEDGETIVFQSSLDLTGHNPCETAHIFRVGADGSGLTQLTPSGECAVHEHPVISRDGSTVVYQQDGAWLFAVPAGGGTPGLVVMDSSTYPKMPRLSHDGTRVVYQSDSNITGGNSDASVEAFLAHTDGTLLEQVSQEVGPWSQPSPDISADGSRVAFAQWGFAPNYYYNDIWFFAPATGMREPATEYVTASDTRLSGDGEYVYFNRERLRASTGEIERASGLFDPRAAVFDARFAVDGIGRAVFAGAFNSTQENPDLGHELWIVDFEETPVFDIEGTTPARVRWTPDPRGVAYDLIRGDLANIGPGTEGTVDLGPVTCLLDDSPTTVAEDPAGPAPNQVFFYLFRWADDWGSASSGAQRVGGSGDCSP